MSSATPASRRQRPPAQTLGVPLRLWLRLKHGVRLGRQVSKLGSTKGMWWLLPLVVIIVIVAIAVTTTTTALPVAVYTLF